MNRLHFLRGGVLIGAAAVMLAGVVLAASCGGGDNSSATTTATAPTQASKPTVTDQRARATVNDTTGVYFTVMNPGAADRLLSVKADPEIAGLAQLHEMAANGATMKMQEVKAGIVVPANGALELKPGGYHVMLMNLKKPLSAGDSLKLDLVFEKAGTISIVVPVVQDAGAAGSSAGKGTAGPPGAMGGAMPKTPASPTKAP